MELSLTKMLNLSALVLALALVSGCSGSSHNFDDDPDLLTDSDEIPNRSGIIESLAGKKLEVEF